MLQQTKKRKADDEPFEKKEQVDLTNRVDPQYIIDREELEKVRIDALYKIDEEKRRNQQKKKEIDVLEKLNKDYSNIDSSSNSVYNNNKVKEILQSGGENIVELMVGGKLFVTSLSTLNKRDNMIKTMLNSGLPIDRDANNYILLNDRNPDYFPIILEHIRTGSTNYVGLCESPSEENIENLKALLMESDFFGTNKLSAKIAKLIHDLSIEKNQNQALQSLLDSAEMVDEEQSKKVKEAKRTTLNSNQAESDEKWLEQFEKLTLKERTVLDEFMKKKQDELEKEREELRQREASLKKEPITFNVRGVKFCIGIEKLLVHPESIFHQLVLASSDKEIFLDRDSEIFSVIFEFLESGTFNSVPKDWSKRKLVYKEAKEFKLNGLLEFLDPLRYPIEDIGVENIKIKKDEDFLRDLYSSDRENPILSDPYIHLVSVFGNENATRALLEQTEPPQTVSLLFDFENPVEASELINEHSNLTLPPVPNLCSTREEFFTQFNALTCGIFKNMDWSNVFVAGGGILACMLKAELERKDLLEARLDRYRRSISTTVNQAKKKILYEEDDGSDSDQDQIDTDGYFTASEDEDNSVAPNCFKQARSFNPSAKPIEKDLDEQLFDYFNKSYWGNSDIDLFLYALTAKEAENKIIYLYNLFKKNLADIPHYARGGEANPDDILLIRTENAVTFKFISSVRTVQIILRIYKAPAEVLIGFDVNCCCVGFDGNQVFALPRAIQAIKTRCNIVDTDRQSTTYELRLAKYALRGFRIGIAGYDEKRIQNDMLIKDCFYRPHRRRYFQPKKLAKLGNVTGLAKLLLLRHSYKNSKFRGGLKSIGGGRDIDSAEKMVSKSKFHDYVEINFSRRRYFGATNIVSANQLFENIHSRTEYIVEEAKKKLFFEYSLNDVNEIIASTNPKSDLPLHIEWITYEPTRQYVVGSFHPHKLNFFKDAYTDAETESKASGKKKMSKYLWSISGRRFRKVLNEEESKQVEIAYRLYNKDPKDQNYVLNDGRSIDFGTMSVTENSASVSWGWRRYRAIRSPDASIFVKSTSDTVTDIHQVLSDPMTATSQKEKY